MKISAKIGIDSLKSGGSERLHGPARALVGEREFTANKPMSIAWKYARRKWDGLKDVNDSDNYRMRHKAINAWMRNDRLAMFCRRN